MRQVPNTYYGSCLDKDSSGSGGFSILALISVDLIFMRKLEDRSA